MVVIHWPIHLKFLRNSPSPCLPKWKAREGDWKAYEVATKVSRPIENFSCTTDAYDYLGNIMICGAMGAIPRTKGNPRRPLVPWWNDSYALSRKVTLIRDSKDIQF